MPDICQQFSKGQGVLTNPPGGKTAPAKLRLAFEAAPFSLLVEMAGGKSSDAVEGGSILDVTIEGIDQRTSLAIGSADEVDRFTDLVLTGEPPIPFGADRTKPESKSKAVGGDDATEGGQEARAEGWGDHMVY